MELRAASGAGLFGPTQLSLSLLFLIASGAAAAPDVPVLAGLAGAALLSGALLATSLGPRLLGPFAAPLRLLAPLALALVALARTGGIASDLFPFLVVFVAAQAVMSRDGGRFVAVGTYAGLGLLAALSPAATAAAARSMALRFVWPAAAAVGVELAMRAKESARASALRDAGRDPTPEIGAGDREERVRVEASAGRKRAAAPLRDPRAEMLHDMKSPLTVLRVYSDLAAEAASRGELPSEAHLAALGREIALLEALVGIAPRASASAPPAPGPAPSAASSAPRSDLVRVLSTLVESYRLAHGRRVRLEFVAEGAEILVTADPVALQRAFRNVLDNAVKYTPAGGQVRVRASVAAQHAFVVISDTGAGMTPDEQEHAFTFAWRSPSASGVPGRGLGLGVTKDLLEQNGGKISLLSEPGHGLEVTIMFPIARGAGA